MPEEERHTIAVSCTRAVNSVGHYAAATERDVSSAAMSVRDLVSQARLTGMPMARTSPTPCTSHAVSRAALC